MSLTSTIMRRILLTTVFAGSILYAQNTGTPISTEEGGTGPSVGVKILRSFGLQKNPGKQGNNAYNQGDYTKAQRKYAEAAAEERGKGLPASPALSFNTGNALYKQKRFSDAASSFEKALKGTKLTNTRDSSFAARVHYNLGNSLYQKGVSADSSATEQAIGDLRDALAHYKKSLQIHPEGRDTKQNLEQAQALLQQLLKKQQQQQKSKDNQKPPEPSPRAKEALARALQLTQEHRYPEAMKVLNDILRTDPTAASFQSHLQRLDDVNKVQNGQEPASSPSPGNDPRARQNGLGI